MNKLYKIPGLILAFALAVFFQACDDDIDPIIEELNFERAFTPLDLDVKVRNQLNAEVTWTVSQNIDHYVLEIHNDSMLFGSLVVTQDVLPAEVPVTIELESEEQYSVRIKAVSTTEGQDESKWGGIAFKTSKENIFNPLTDENIGKQEATLSWPAGSAVTHFMITPGDVRRDLSDDEIAAGEATVTGLDFDTEYTVIMFNGVNPKQRGDIAFTTLPEGITLTAADDLSAAIAGAVDGEIFLLEGGEYTAYKGMITIDKSIVLKGLSSEDMPVLNVQFVIADGAANVELSNIEMDGKYTDELEVETILDHAIQYSSSATAVGNITLTTCNIHDYNKSLVSASSGAFTVESITFDDCMIADILNDGGDFIDFRKSFPAAITVTNTTFVNCATANNRDFFRLDGFEKGNAFDDGAHTPVITVTANTFYNVQNNASGGKRFFYVRWQNSPEVLNVERNLFVNSTANYSSSSDTDMAIFSKNNYFNAPGFLDSSKSVYDNSGTHSELDPGFADAANNDFSVSTQAIIDDAIGALRWR